MPRVNQPKEDRHEKASTHQPVTPADRARRRHRRDHHRRCPGHHRIGAHRADDAAPPRHRTDGRRFHIHRRTKQGDRFGFGDKITGTHPGHDRGVCTFIGQATALCTIQLQLSNGTLAAQGLLPARSKNTPVAITGGTGAYNGARGTAQLTDIPPNHADIKITLLP